MIVHITCEKCHSTRVIFPAGTHDSVGWHHNCEQDPERPGRRTPKGKRDWVVVQGLKAAAIPPDHEFSAQTEKPASCVRCGKPEAEHAA